MGPYGVLQQTTCAQSSESQTERTRSDIQSLTQAVAIYWMTTKKQTEQRYALNHNSCMYVTRSRPRPAKSAEALGLPGDALQEAIVFLREKKNPLQLTLTAYYSSVTHTVHTLLPVLVMAATLHDAPISNIHTYIQAYRATMQSNHLITES